VLLLVQRAQHYKASRTAIHVVCRWRDALETVINSRKLSDALGNPSTQRKCFYCPIWRITLYFIRQEQLYALLKNKRKETYIK